jgi:hypothetical protein
MNERIYACSKITRLRKILIPEAKNFGCECQITAYYLVPCNNLFSNGLLQAIRIYELWKCIKIFTISALMFPRRGADYKKYRHVKQYDDTVNYVTFAMV